MRVCECVCVLLLRGVFSVCTFGVNVFRLGACVHGQRCDGFMCARVQEMFAFASECGGVLRIVAPVSNRRLCWRVAVLSCDDAAATVATAAAFKLVRLVYSNAICVPGVGVYVMSRWARASSASE